MDDDPLQLRDPVAIDSLLPEPGWPWWAWALAAAAVVLAAAAAIVIVRRRRQTAAGPGARDVHAAYVRARTAIEEALEGPEDQVAVALSIALRRYLAEICNDSSLYETHQEFIARHRALADFPPPLREKTADLLGRLAERKYDRPGRAPAADLGDAARGLLEELHRRPAAA